MSWTIFGVILFLIFLAGLVVIYVRDRRREKKSVVETMGDSTWDEIAREREENLAKSKKFKDALKKAGERV